MFLIFKNILILVHLLLGIISRYIGDIKIIKFKELNIQ